MTGLCAGRAESLPGNVAVEPFDYVPDGASAAAFAAGCWRGVLEASEQMAHT